MNIGHNKAADWWTVGVLLYELSVGRPPFYSKDVDKMYQKILKAPLNFPPNVSKEFKDLASKLLARNASFRLGAGLGDVREVFKHPYFFSLDLSKLSLSLSLSSFLCMYDAFSHCPGYIERKLNHLINLK